MTAFRTILFYLFIFITYGVILMVTSDHCFDAFSAVQDNLFLTRHTYRKVSAYSVYACAAECLMSSACLSFSYNKHRRICHLNDNTTVTDIVPSQDFIYSDISPWPQSLSGPCAVTPCSGNTRCQVDRLQRASCVSEFQGCGQPTEVPGSHKEYEGHSLSDVVFYTCNSDYIQCQDKATSVCQSTGWEDVTGLCGQFRWHNPAVLVQHRLPCGSAYNLTLTFKATPTVRNRFTVDFINGNDHTATMDFRLGFDVVTDDKLVLTSYYQGAWQTAGQKLEPLQLFVGTEYHIVISLHNGQARVEVDGWISPTYTCQVPDPLVEYVRISRDVTIRLLEITL